MFSRVKRETLDELRRRFVTRSTAILVSVILALIAVQVITTRVVTDHAANNEAAAVAPAIPSPTPSPTPSPSAPLAPAPTGSPEPSGWPVVPSPSPTPTPLGDGWGSRIAQEEAEEAATVEGAAFWDRINSGKSLRATIKGNVQAEDCEGLKRLYGAMSRSPGPYGEPEDVALVLAYIDSGSREAGCFDE